MPQVTADIASGLNSFGIEAFRMNHKTMMIGECFCNYLLQGSIGGAYFTESFTKQIAPFCGKAICGDAFNLHPFAIRKAAFGDDQMDMGFEVEVTAEGMDGVNHADAHIWIEIFQDFADGLSGNLQEEFQQRAVGIEERPQEVVGGEGDMLVGHIEHVFGDIVDPVVHVDLAA